LNELGNSAAKLPADLARRLVDAERWVVMTGSGVSAESGVPTFRDAQTGLWARYDPLQLATPEAFERDPELVWRWYQWRRELIGSTVPNPAHTALAELQRLKPELTLVTQNVDGLHQRAGSTSVIEFHGSIQGNKCFRCGRPGESAEYSGESPPRCAHCEGYLRPDVVWFGEAIPTAALEAASRAVAGCEVFFSVGTSSLVYPAAALAETASSHKALVVEINTDETPLSAHADFALQGSAATWLPVIAASLPAHAG